MDLQFGNVLPQKSWCAKSKQLKGNTFVFRKILRDVGGLSFWRAQPPVLVANGDFPRAWPQILPASGLPSSEKDLLVRLAPHITPTKSDFGGRTAPDPREEDRPGSC